MISLVTSDDPKGPAQAIAAATAILLRDTPSGAAEVLIVRRDSTLSFAGGAWVFPGGRLDEADFADSRDDLDAAERRAAARESEEEAGLTVDPASLVRFSHWTPPPQTTKRFSTAFFVGRAPEGRVVIDDGEIRDHSWSNPLDVLAGHRAGDIQLTPPTFITLTQLAERRTVDEIISIAARGPTEHFATRIAMLADRVAALYHGDAGYEAYDASIDGPRHRLWMDPDGWTYERDEITRPR